MKKLLVGLLALGLVFSFSVPVMATDLSVSGSYRIRGWLDSNSQLWPEGNAGDAYYDQRMRVQPTFKVVDGLSATIRFDALEGVWGGDLRSPAADEDGVINLDANVQFDKAYVTFLTAYGQVEAGFKSTDVWGTDFGNTEAFVGEIDFMTKLSEDLAVLFRVEKDIEGDAIYFETEDSNTIEDRDKDAYIAAVVYKKEGVEAGMLYKYVRDAYSGSTALGLAEGEVLKTIHVLSPYFKATVGPAYVEGQIYYGTGDMETDLGRPDFDLQDLLIYLLAKGDVGPGYVGGMFAWSQGDDDPGDTDAKGAIFNGSDWNPCLILFNDTEPSSLGWYGTTGAQLQNAYLFQVFGGMTPMEKLSVMASLSYAYADEQLNYVDDEIGTEFDITASYKIYDNLDYTVGFGYLFAGDYYKGTDKDNKIDDTYLLMNKLQLNF
jgi:hypothetical protein